MSETFRKLDYADDRWVVRDMTPEEVHRATSVDRLNAAAVVADGKDGRPSTFVQWKGTDVSVDFRCPCGMWGTIDGYFMYAVKCAACGRRWEMGTQLMVRPLADDEPDPPSMLELTGE